MEGFYQAYSITSQIMFPILVFILVLIVRDLTRYSKISEKIKKTLNEISEDIADTGFSRNAGEKDLDMIIRFIKSKIS